MQLTFNPPTKSASPSEQTATKRRRSDRIRDHLARQDFEIVVKRSHSDFENYPHFTEYRGGLPFNTAATSWQTLVTTRSCAS